LTREIAAWRTVAVTQYLGTVSETGSVVKLAVANVNWFMNVPVLPDGSMAIVDGWSKPGDYVDLKAETDEALYQLAHVDGHRPELSQDQTLERAEG